MCLGIALFASPFHADVASGGLVIVAPPNKKRHYKHAPSWVAPSKGPAAETTLLGSEEPPAVIPEAAPSLSLQPFLDTHLDKILAPLGTAAFAQSDLITYVRDDYAGALPTAPESRKPAYQLAVAVCDTMIHSIAERQKAVDALNGSYERRKSESVQPRGGKRAVKDSDKDEAFFYDSQKNNWLQNASSLRLQVTALFRRELAAETQAGEWLFPTPAVADATTPTVSVPAPAVDPVVGDWKWHNNGPLKLEADGSISGSRSGKWQYTCTTDGVRNYELHWAHKDWVDYVVLSADRKLLDGKSKQGKHVTANR